jgi:ABC-type Fe3+/spermidine/putrescine transport system ATPase subunit
MSAPQPDEAHVRIRGLSKSFGRVHALTDVSLDIPRGSFTTFLGPSGCGKTTLLRTIAGFYEADAGTISIAGRLINGVPSHLRGAVMVFQDYALFPHLTAAENIAYGLKVKKLPHAEISRRLSSMASYLSVEGLLSRKPAQLSGGQQQRIALARALVMEPEVLLLDEPLSNLDAKLREGIRAELRRMQKSLRITTIYVTHDQTEALSMSDQVVVMNHGGVAQAGSPREVYFSPRDPFVASFVGMANLLEARVLEVTASQVACDAGGTRLEAACTAAPPLPGSRVILSVRPEHIQLSPEPAVSPSSAAIPGTVVSSLFEGSRVRYWVQAMGREIVVDVPEGDRVIEAGRQVSLSFPMSRVHVMQESSHE